MLACSNPPGITRQANDLALREVRAKIVFVAMLMDLEVTADSIEHGNRFSRRCL
jgi:hypothetical protein